MIEIRFRPLGVWQGEQTERRRPSQFRTPFERTLNTLTNEVKRLLTPEAQWMVIELAVGEDEIRLDGWPRASARPTHPGVVVSFESRFGPLRYATDVYNDWHDNLRAIALSLESLRAVDRYGVTKRGEQYTGWKALGVGDVPKMSRREAATLLAREAEFYDEPAIDRDELAKRVLKDPSTYLASVYRRAVKRHHPDVGGDRSMYERLERARQVLRAG